MNLIFDLDGTLVDSAPGVLSSLAHVIEKHQISYPDNLTSEIIGPPLREMLIKLFGSDTNQLKIDKMIDTFKLHYDQKGVFNTTAFVGIDDMLLTLKNRGHTLYIATNKRIEPTQKLLKYFSWHHFFCNIYSLNSFDPTLKNKSALLSKIIKIHSLDIADTIYIGDRQEDSQAAIQNNLEYLHAIWGYGGGGKNIFSMGALVEPADIYSYV